MTRIEEGTITSPRRGDAQRPMRNSPAREITHALLRIGAGILFMFHGMPKLFGWFGGMGGPGQSAELFSQMGAAGALEVFGGLLIVVGLATRPVAAILAIEMIWAYLQAHLPQGWVPLTNGGELAVLYFLIFAYLTAHGAGPASVDRKLAARTGMA